MLACLPNSLVTATCAFTSWRALSLSKIGLSPASLSPVRAPRSPATPEMPAVLVELALPLSEPMPTPESPALRLLPGAGVPAATPTLTLLAS